MDQEPPDEFVLTFAVLAAAGVLGASLVGVAVGVILRRWLTS